MSAGFGLCSGVNVSSNILGGATQGGVYFHQGGMNSAQNNIIVDGTQYQVRATVYFVLFEPLPSVVRDVNAHGVVRAT